MLQDVEHPEAGKNESDYYETLGVAKRRRREGAQERFPQARHAVPSRPQSRRSFLRVKFKEINEAYQTLKDPQKRAAYDRFGHAAFEWQGGMNGGAQSRFLRLHVADIFEDILRRHDGRRRRRSSGGRERGADLRYNWKSGSKRPLPARPPRSACRPRSPANPAPAAAPSPARSPSPARPAQRPRQGARHAGLLLDRADLPAMPGARRVIDDPCPKCAGAGPRHRGAFALGQHSRPASRTARASALPMRAKPACAAGLRATSTFSCRSSRTRSSSATAPICSAACRSR
jgi:molecular chaperone DnaJ